MLAPRAAGDDDDGRLRTEDLEFSLYDGDQIDVAPLVAEQLILALPSRALCREDCKGLCPNCGRNRNAEPCSCHQPQEDPRWEALKEIREKLDR